MRSLAAAGAASAAVSPIDLHQGAERVIGAYLVETSDGPAVFDCGPASALPALEAGLREHGVGLADVRHLLLSHIHLDHAGAAGTIVHEHPHVQVHVSAIGAPHLVDPSRLEASAPALRRRLRLALGRARSRAGGEHPDRRRRAVGLECFATPGHASHHVLRAGQRDLPATRRASGSRRAGSSSRRRLRPTSTSSLSTIRVLEQRSTRSASRSCTSVCSRTSAATGRAAPAARTVEQFVESGATGQVRRPCTQGFGDLDDDDLEQSSARCRCGSPTPG